MSETENLLVDTYELDEQVGYLMRLASQRHAVIFQKHAGGNLTPTQFTTLLRVAEVGTVSQNQLGRLAGMDVATIKGVIDRLRSKALIQSQADPDDKRRSNISLTPQGAAMIDDLKSMGHRITAETLEPLTPVEQKTLAKLLRKIG